MSVLRQKVKLIGTRGEKEVTAIFDSGSNITVLKEEIAKEIGDVIEGPEVEIKEKFTPAIVEINGCKTILPIRVRKDMLEDFVIGADSMQIRKIKLDFENDKVIVGDCELRV